MLDFTDRNELRQYLKPAFNTPANSIKPHKHWALLFDVTNFRLKRLVFCPKRDDIST